MVTPSEIQDKQFKNGIGYDKKDVETFLQIVASDMTILQQENDDLKKKLKEANESIAYYKSIEKTLQKALILAEKTAQDTKANAIKEADIIEKEAKSRAEHILFDARKQTECYEHKIINLKQQYDLFRIQFENLLKGQQELLNSKSFDLQTEGFTYQEVNQKVTDSKEEQEAFNPEEVYKNLAAISLDPDAALHAQEDVNQIKFNFLKEEIGPVSYQTEDGFEFFNMKDE